MTLVDELRAGCVTHPKRWSGDTHADLGGTVNEDATDALLLAAAEEIERMKRGFEEMAEKVAVLRAQAARHHVRRRQQIAHTRRWRAEAKELRRVVRVALGEHFDDELPQHPLGVIPAAAYRPRVRPRA